MAPSGRSPSKMMARYRRHRSDGGSDRYACRQPSIEAPLCELVLGPGPGQEQLSVPCGIGTLSSNCWSLTNGVRVELASQGTLVSALVPGLIGTQR